MQSIEQWFAVINISFDGTRIENVQGTPFTKWLSNAIKVLDFSSHFMKNCVTLQNKVDEEKSTFKSHLKIRWKKRRSSKKIRCRRKNYRKKFFLKVWRSFLSVCHSYSSVVSLIVAHLFPFPKPILGTICLWSIFSRMNLAEIHSGNDLPSTALNQRCIQV